jgi:ribosomal protein S18 acetylase RimI-like enzyme
MMNPASMTGTPFVIRMAFESDAEAIIAILEGVAAERIHTAIHNPWSADQQRRFMARLSSREAVHLAESETGVVVGYQTLELWASMAHVGQLGTFLSADWRRRGVGEALFRRTLVFAREHEFSKFVIQVRASNNSAQSFYRSVGFRVCGRLSRQVRIDGFEDDEILMEFFL